MTRRNTSDDVMIGGYDSYRAIEDDFGKGESGISALSSKQSNTGVTLTTNYSMNQKWIHSRLEQPRPWQDLAWKKPLRDCLRQWTLKT